MFSAAFTDTIYYVTQLLDHSTFIIVIYCKAPLSPCNGRHVSYCDDDDDDDDDDCYVIGTHSYQTTDHRKLPELLDMWLEGPGGIVKGVEGLSLIHISEPTRPY